MSGQCGKSKRWWERSEQWRGKSNQWRSKRYLIVYLAAIIAIVAIVGIVYARTNGNGNSDDTQGGNGATADSVETEVVETPAADAASTTSTEQSPSPSQSTAPKAVWLNPAEQKKVIQTNYPSEDIVIAEYNVADYGAVADGKTDDTEAVQKALNAARSDGGGVVFVPAGFYKIAGTLFVPTGVTLRGDRSNSWTSGAVEGTILQAYSGRGDEKGESFISLQQASGITNLSIWYPEQSLDQPYAYPWTIEQMSGDSATVEKVTLVNAYNGIKVGPDWNELHYIKQVYGTVLKTGVFLDFTTDIGRLEGIRLSPEYWANSGLPGSPAPEALFEYTTKHAEGIVMGRSDWEYMSDIRLAGFKTGMRVTTRTNSDETANAQFYRIDIDNCNVALLIEGVNDYGLLITDSSFQANVGENPTAIRATSGFRSIVQFNTVKVGGMTRDAVVNEGSGVLSFENSEIGGWDSAIGHGIVAKSGSLILGGTNFVQPEGHVLIEADVKSVKALNSGFQGKLDLTNRATKAEISVTQDDRYVLKRLPDVKNLDIPVQPKPATSVLFNVREAPYFADGNGDKDASAAVKQALADAGNSGGGTVYLPAGKYRIEEPLSVPSGVELRGSWDVPHHTIGGGSVIFTNYGENDPEGVPFIVLEADAGIRGLNVYYDGQDWNAIKPFAWTIQGKGRGVYVIDTTLPDSYQGIDFGSYDTSGHYIDYVAGSPLKEGIHVGGGATGGIVRNVQFNPHYAARSEYPNRPMDNEFDKVWGYQKENLDAFRIGNVKDQTIFNTFVYGSLYGIHFASQNGVGPEATIVGPEATIVGHGTDGSKKGVFLEDAGPGGLVFINTELVSMSTTDKVYVTVGEGFQSEVTFFNTSMWGDPSRGIDVRSGKLTMQQGNFTVVGFRGINSGGGEMYLYDSFFKQAGKTHAYAGELVKRMVISNNLYNGPIGFDDDSKPGTVTGTDIDPIVR
ncbi:glycosyl hydrolase family 28-related protein [Cohnella herbarum]|uniref:Rhamnogalacturonase A/B/Epimerase-like pectate lyase domain-containing protein n=1 Tax=Cohnella herbarum TaxID=2728023 RepID=A0A7Z2ZP71_9BACL|nr:glycosyl hydrolase family 28-related protein [Cohnella herbarum]QJD87053.1 hypothetical protein HH215_30340 [Cohnella herbarum]